MLRPLSPTTSSYLQGILRGSNRQHCESSVSLPCRGQNRRLTSSPTSFRSWSPFHHSGGPQTPRMDSPSFNTNASPTARDPLYMQPYSPPSGMGAPRDSFMAPAPSFMSMGRNSRHDSYSSFDSGKGFAAGAIDKRGSYASGVSSCGLEWTERINPDRRLRSLRSSLPMTGMLDVNRL